MSNLDWMDFAACRDHDADLFFPSSVGVAAQQQAEQAARVCAVCPVQLECAGQRTRSGASAGIWGGSYHRTHPPKKLPPISHGTDTGYHQHMNRREPACRRCRFAHAHAERQRIAAKGVGA